MLRLSPQEDMFRGRGLGLDHDHARLNSGWFSTEWAVRKAGPVGGSRSGRRVFEGSSCRHFLLLLSTIR